MKRATVVVGWLFFGCLVPVQEGLDAGPCRESLGVADGLPLTFPYGFAGEHRSGGYFFADGQLVDDRSFSPVTAPGAPVVWPCTSWVGASWQLTPEAAFLKFVFEKNGRAYVLLYEYTDQLQGQLNDACVADGGFGQAAVLLALTPDRAWFDMRFAGIAKTDSGFLACSAHLDDAGVPREMVLYRTDDGGVVSRVPSSAEHCRDLRPPLALAFSRDGGGELINFDTRRRVVELPGADFCRVTLEGSALCGRQGAVTLVGGQGSTELVREEGAAYQTMNLTVRDRQYVRRISADGGNGWYWFRNGALELLDEGMPLSLIGDFDDRNLYYVVSRRSPDGGNEAEFVRRCLPK